MAPVQPISHAQAPMTIPVPVTVPAGVAPPSHLTPPSSLLTRSQRFIEENKLIILGCAVVAAGGLGYYMYNRSSALDGSAPGPSSGGPGGGGGAGAGGKKKNKKSKKKGGMQSGFLKGEGTDGPLIEEIEKKSEETGSKTTASASASSSEMTSERGPLDGVPSQEVIGKMSDAERNELGRELKDKGNKLYSRREFRQAVECYTKAIEVSIKKDAVFFSNRAACYTNYSPPEYEKCVADCDEALKLDHTYVKALKRRATAYETLGRDEEAVRDFTAVTIIERFQDQQAAESVERCLKKLATKKAKEQMEGREPKLPSPSFISSYLTAFRPHPKPTLPANPSQGDQTLLLAFDALEATDYKHAVSFCNEAIEQGVSWKDGQAEAYNMRGTFKFLVGDSIGAKADFEKSIDLHPSFVQSWVKIASVHMELGDAASAFGDFEQAIRYDAKNPDIYYHRGQVYFIMQEFDKAIADYNKSTELDDTFIFTHVQAAVAQYKQGKVGASMAAFRRILKQFPDRGEPSNYYGELLLDQQKHQESIERFDRSIELDKNRRPRNVLPLVNKALAIFQWKQSLEEAEKLCQKALEIDPDCDVAVATLAQLSLQQGRIEDAVMYFEKSGKLARTEVELMNAITYEYASRSQQAFLRDYPEFAERLSQMAAGM